MYSIFDKFSVPILLVWWYCNIFYGVDDIIVFVNFANLKNIHKEIAPLNKTLALTKNMNIDIWVTGTSNQLLKGSFTETKFSRKIK